MAKWRIGRGLPEGQSLLTTEGTEEAEKRESLMIACPPLIPRDVSSRTGAHDLERRVGRSKRAGEGSAPLPLRGSRCHSIISDSRFSGSSAPSVVIGFDF